MHIESYDLIVCVEEGLGFVGSNGRNGEETDC